MTVLYHGSHYCQTELMPGFKRSGKLVQWDKTESNQWLYATTDREAAMVLGFASAVEKHFDLHHFRVINKGYLELIFEKNKPTFQQLKRLAVYIYTIHKGVGDGWQKVNNLTNGIETEFKTQQTIQSNIINIEALDLYSWLRAKEVKLKTLPPEYVGWAATQPG